MPVAPNREASSVTPVFIFVNPRSGGNAASVWMDKNAPQSPLTLTPKQSVLVSIFDISAGSKGNKPGFIKLRKSVNETTRASPIRVIVAGGDGTVMWCLSEMATHDVDASKVAVGVMPFGTGNDFARALEWSLPSPLKPFDDDYRQLRELASKWMSALAIKHDLWKVSVSCRRIGSFLKVEDGKKAEILDDDGRLQKEMNFAMSNYFSVGVESRIGVGFDKNRTTSAFKNKLVYTTEGMKKTLFTSTMSTNETVHDLSINNTPVFTSEPSAYPLLKPSASLISVNIPSFCAGLDVWGKAETSGLEGQTQLPPELKSVQRLGDGILEWVSFASAAKIGMEVTDPGHAKRLVAGAGPFTINFNDNFGDKKVYFQVDGEFFVVRAPRKAVVAHDRTITVLANPDSKKQKHYILV